MKKKMRVSLDSMDDTRLFATIRSEPKSLGETL